MNEVIDAYTSAKLLYEYFYCCHIGVNLTELNDGKGTVRVPIFLRFNVGHAWRYGPVDALIILLANGMLNETSMYKCV